MIELRNKNVKSVFGGIGIASLLCVLMVLMSWSAMVTNSDINSVSTETTESERADLEETYERDDEIQQTSFEAETLGFDEDLEMLGMRTTHSKTFIDDEGKLHSVHSFKPLHIENQYGQLVDIDTAILSGDSGYYVNDIYTPAQFSHNPMDGVEITIAGEQIKTGLNPTPVTIFHGTAADPFLNGIEVPYHNTMTLEDGVFMPPTETVKVGGNSISYPMSATIDMQYHVNPSEIKQEFVINTLSKEVRMALEDQMTVQRETDSSTQGFFGFQEIVALPDDVQLMADGEIINDGVENYGVLGQIDIIKADTGLTLGYIAAPHAFDSSTNDGNTIKEGMAKEDFLAQLTPNIQYFLTLEGSELTITTAVDLEWLLSDYTSFPVVIDPAVGSNTLTPDTTTGYMVCDIAAEDCHSRTDGRFQYDYHSSPGAHLYSPIFDFTFTQTTALSVASVSVTYEFDDEDWISSGDAAGLLIMEECGDYVPSSAYSGNPDLNSIYYPAECTGTPLSAYTPAPPPPTPPADVEHVFDNFGDGEDCLTDNDVYGTQTYQYAVTSDMTQCDDGSASGNLVAVDFLSETSSYMNGGIFDSGDYKYRGYDSWFSNNVIEGGGGIYIQTRTIGTSQWNDLISIGSFAQADHEPDNVDRYFTVNSGDEMRLAYHCPAADYGDCYPGENSLYIKQEPSPPLLPEIFAGNSGSPAATEPASVSFTVLQNEEAYFEYTTGSNPGDADQTEIYYRLAGTSGWTNYWDLCTVTPASTPPCQSPYTYTSEASVLIQTPGNYEALVWDTAGDGSGPGSGGQVIIDSLGNNGAVQLNPSQKRINSLISSEQIVNLPLTNGVNTAQTVNVCGSVVACSTGTMSMFTDAYTDGAHGGYIEFSLGWLNAENAIGGWSGSTTMDATADFSDFFLTVELEDNTPDATPPVVESSAHYTDLTSYVAGARTLYIELSDAGNPILYTSTEGPTLHYSVDGGNTYSEADATLLSSCAVKNQVCLFSATTSDLPADTTVDYYWTYSDAAANDNTKIPPQTPNPGRFPASGAADLTFTIADVYDSTGNKLTTLFEDVYGPDANSGSVWTSNGYFDRQMTYYAENGEFMFEFDFSNCGVSYTSTTYLEENCFWDADVHGFGDQSYGHWDINWEGASSACFPGATGCTAAPTNTLELDSHFGGIVDVSRYGVDNLLFVYDSNSNDWAIAGLGTTGIDNKLTTDMNDVVQESYTANMFTPPVQINTLYADSSMRTYYHYLYGGPTWGFIAGPVTVPQGDVARIVYECASYCSEQTLGITDSTYSFIHHMGYYGGGFYSGSNRVYYSNVDFSTHNAGSNAPAIPNGLLGPGDYYFFSGDPGYGDYSEVKLTIESFTGTSWPSGPSSPYDLNSVTDGGYTVEAYIIDLADSATPAIGTNDGFAGVPLGTSAGEFNQICVTTGGHVIFMEKSNADCTPDAVASSAGGSWQGFALGANAQGGDYTDDGLLWSIRPIEPDPDYDAPVVTGGQIGDSHALTRTVTYTIADTRYADMGVDTSPVPGVGPSLHTTITSADGTVTTDVVALVPSGDRNACSTTECEWTYQFTGLERGDTVSYYMTVADLYPPAPNVETGDTYGFTVGTPTNTLVVEWVEYREESYYVDGCSMQVIMYDVTNEIEFHYEDDAGCFTDDNIGTIAIRESQSNYLEVANNFDLSHFDNPHNNNWRFTLSPTGDYLVEPFELGMNPLPLVSSTQALQVASTSWAGDSRCDQGSATSGEFSQNLAYCANNFDIPDDFNFEFYGQSYDGANPDNRIQVLTTGFLHFIDDGDTTERRIETNGGNGGTCFNNDGGFPSDFWATCGGGYNILRDGYKTPSTGILHAMAPYFAREIIDFCGASDPADTNCQGVWYRTLPYDGAGRTISADITEDTTFYLIDSPIKINPTGDYLSIAADLTIEAGVEVIVAENKGISFDGGVQADGTCAQFTTLGTTTDRVTFTADTTFNANALWNGLAFTSDCGSNSMTDRHVITSTDFSNTNYAAITAGSRGQGDPAYPKCGNSNQDCDVGEFTMDDVTFSNVETAFSHGSGQGTVVTMSNFAVTDARMSCFDFAENTVATLTGVAGNPSTMTRCNTNNDPAHGAITSTQGSNAGSLTMEYVNIEDSKINLIKTDLQMITISDVTATTPTINDQYSWGDQGIPAEGDARGYSSLYDTTGVSLGLTHGQAAEVVITNFNAPDYHQAYICAAAKVSLDNVDLGNGFDTNNFHNHRLNIDPYCGAIVNTPGSMGTNSVFNDVTAASITMYRTFPGTADQITTAGDFTIAELGVTGGSQDAIAINNAAIGGVLIADGCGSNLEVALSSFNQMSSFCNTPAGTSSIEVLDSTMAHSSTDSAIYLQQSAGTFINVDVTSTTATASGPFVLYADLNSDAYLIDVTLNTNACADNNGKTSDCYTGINGDPNVAPTAVPEIYYGGFANALAYRQGVDSTTGNPTQIPEQGATVTASVLDSNGAELFPSKVFYRAITGADGRTAEVAVFTGDHTGTVYDSHHVRASGAAGAGEAHPVLSDGTPATVVEFVDGTLQTPPLADFSTYNIGGYADIRLVSPPVTLDDTGMDCAWMANEPLFIAADTGSAYEFKGATMVLAEDMYIDGCTIILEGSQIQFRQDSVNNPTLTIGDGGMLVMKTDAGTGDFSKIFGEGALDAVDVVLESGAVLDMQSGTMKNFILDATKGGQLEVPSGAELKLGGGAYLTSSDITSFGASYPMINVDGGLVTVSSSAFLAGSGNLGYGVNLENEGAIVGDGLTVSDMAVGINSDGGSINLDQYTSTDNTNGIVAKDGPKLPTMYSSAVLQGIALNYPSNIGTGPNARELPNMDNCWFFHRFGCFEWSEYTVDLTSWVGQTDYLQPAMMINYGGTYTYGYTVGGYGLTSWSVPYVTLDNLVIEVTDNTGATYLIEDSDDIGYYPYGDNDPAVVNDGMTYNGGLGGAPFWDCNYGGESPNPWRWGERLDTFYTYTSTPSIGNLYGMSDDGYPDQFGFRITEGTVPEPISVQSYPEFNWGFDDPITGRFGIGTGGAFGYPTIISNLNTWHDTTIGETRSTLQGTYGSPNYEACNARSPTPRTTAGSNMMLNWPTIDLTDPSIESVELKFDMMHRYLGNSLGHFANSNPDNVEILTRSGSDPSAFGEFTEQVYGKGVVLSNAAITGADIGIDLLGGTYTDISGLDIDDPTQFGVRTSGVNSVYLDGLDIDDSGLGANNNYGFYAPSSSAGKQQITNSDFNGLGTAMLLNNDVGTDMSNIVISNGATGIDIGSQSSANHNYDTMTISNVDVGIVMDGTGELTVEAADLSTTTSDLSISSGTVTFVDGTVDQAKVDIDSTSTGKFNRDRSYFATLLADGSPLAEANVVMSSQVAATTSSGTTDSNGVTSGLEFSIYDLDANGVTDYTGSLGTYTISSVAMIDYSYDSATVNSGDFRYIQATPTLSDQPYDSVAGTNYESFSLTDQIDVRICSSESDDIVVAPCAGTLAANSDRVYTNGMVEYGAEEGLYDGAITDLSGKAIMIDTGTLEFRNDVEYILDNAIIFDTGYNTEFGTALAQWISDWPYDTMIKMHGGEVNGLYPETDRGDVVGLIIGGLQGPTENALNLDIDGVTFNNIVGIATGTGERTSTTTNTYVPSTVSITNSFIYHYRDIDIRPTLFSDSDYCIRLTGLTAATISGNTLANCVLGVSFMESYYDSTQSSIAHDAVGADNVVIDGNTFVGTAGINLMGWADSDADNLVFTNNVLDCNACSHIRFQDDTSFNPRIESNTFNGGDYGVNTDDVERVNIKDNTFNNQAEFAIRAFGGDFNIIDNTINNPGEYAVYADSLSKPTEVAINVVAGINADYPVVAGQFINWPGDECTRATRPCVSPDIYADNLPGQEMVLVFEEGDYPEELTIVVTQPDGTQVVWGANGLGGVSTGEDSYSDAGIILTQVGVHAMHLIDSYGDGPNGGGFEVHMADAGTFSGLTNSNPKSFWDPGVNGLLSVEPTSRYAGYSWGTSYYGASGCSKDMDGVILQNTGTDPVVYEFTGIDLYNDGWGTSSGPWYAYNGNIRMYEAPVGTWTPQFQSGPSWTACQIPTLGTLMGGIGDGLTVPFEDGTYSEPLTLTLNPGQEMHFRYWCYAYCGEVALQIQEAAAVDPTWVGPTIKDNTIDFDSVNNNPLAVGLHLENCDVTSYSVLTESNTINIGQNAVVNQGCIWNDKDSVITGSDQSGSIGFDDDNSFGFAINLDGTTMSGFETAVYKTGSGTLTLTGGAHITAGSNGYGVHTEDIEVYAVDAKLDGGVSGTGMLVEDSPYAWLYPMDVTGNIGLHAKNTDVLWDAGVVDADTIMIAETVTGTVQSLTSPAGGGGAGVASASSTTWIDARSDTRLTVVDWTLDETKMLVDSTSVVDEANWLDIDADHLGAEPAAQVGVSIISDQDYAAYTSPTFESQMFVDGNGDDWVGGNELNPSGYAMPGNVGGPMYLTESGNSLVFGFDNVDTTTSDVYIYVDSNDMAGSSTGYDKGAHNLPYDADYVIVATSAGVDVRYYNDPAWVLNPTANAISQQGATLLEIGVPISALGGSSVDSMNIVATVQNTGTQDVTAASPAQTTIVGTGVETLDEAYELTLNKLDLATGVMNQEVLLHRSFEFSNTPTAPHTYQVMVKTPAETRHTCDFDWATETSVVMDTSKSLSFDILRACPEITSQLDNIEVSEDSGAIVLDLATFVDDEQDVEANMEWDVTEVPLSMDAFDDILSDFNDLTAATGTYSITPIADQFGSFDILFEVVDSHGQTDSKTITYTVKNINDAPVICDARDIADPDCDNGELYLYADTSGNRYNSLDEGFASYSKPLGKDANDTLNSFIRDMANEQYPNKQVYTWGADATCDQIAVDLQTNANGVDEIVVTENSQWEEGGVCDITLTLSDDGDVNTDATPVVVQFAVAPINDAPEIAVEGLVQSTDSSNAFQGVPDGSYRLDLVEDTTDANALTFDLSGIKSDIDHLDADLSWTLEDTNTCTSANYYTHQINGDILEFTLIPDATTNAEPWEVDMLNNNGIHQTRTANGRCEMTLTLSDSLDAPSYMPNYTALPEADYEQESVSVTLSVEVDNVAENVPDYFLDATDGFSFNGVNNIMPGTYVPVDFSINAGGDEGPYTYDHLLVVSLHSNGHTEIELPRYYNPPAYGESLDIDDWEVYITDQTTEVWVEVDVVTCNPGSVCTPANNDIQTDNPESHNAVSSSQVFGKWSEPGRIGEDAAGQQSNRRPAFEDKNWCNNMMSTNGGTEVAWSDASTCGHTEQGYNGVFTEDWQTAGTPLPVTVTTIGALSVASFAPSIIAVALTGLFVSALVIAGRREDDEEEFVEETISDDESAVSPVIATILMVAITVVLSGVVYVWAAQLADTDTKGVPRVTFDATNVDTGDTATDHWKITIGQAQTVLATQAVEVSVTYANAANEIVTVTTNLAATNQVYGFSPFNSDQLVTFGDVVTLNDGEVISSFSTGDDIYVKTHDADGTPLVDATIRIIYNPPGDTQGAILKTYSGLSWNQPV